MPSQLPTSSQVIRERQDRLNAALADLARFGEEQREVANYYHEFLKVVAKVIAADAGRVYRRDARGTVKLVADYGSDSGFWTDDRITQLKGDTKGTFDLTLERGADACTWNDRCVVVHVRNVETCFAWVILGFDRSLDDDAKAGIERFSRAATDIAAEYEGQLLRDPSEAGLNLRERLLRLGHELLRIENPDEAAWRFVNEARRLVGCDRLTLATNDGHRGQVWQISDLPRPDKNSDYVRHVEEVASAIPDGRGECWVGIEGEESPTPPLEELLEKQRVISGASIIGVLHPEPSPDAVMRQRAVLLVESFSDSFDRSTVAQVGQLRAGLLLFAETLVERRYRRSLKNRVQHRLLMFGLNRTLVALLTISAIVGLLLMPVPFRVVARGDLVPAIRREIFAPADGIVTTLAVRHDQNVAAGELLVVLDSVELESERSRIQGLLSTVEEELTAAELARVGDVPALDRSDRPADRPAVLAEELRIRRDSLQQQLGLLNQQLQEMTLRSPIQGTVITFALANRLENRPVRRGQSLLQVADLTGDWELRLRVPEQDAGYVLDASESHQQPIRVDFLVTSDPARSYETSLSAISLVTRPDRDAGSVVEATASVPKSLIEKPRPGATVIAKIDCGTRSLGFVWFHEIVNAARTRLFF